MLVSYSIIAGLVPEARITVKFMSELCFVQTELTISGSCKFLADC